MAVGSDWQTVAAVVTTQQQIEMMRRINAPKSSFPSTTVTCACATIHSPAVTRETTGMVVKSVNQDEIEREKEK